jgi:hypothetical protein
MVHQAHAAGYWGAPEPEPEQDGSLASLVVSGASFVPSNFKQAPIILFYNNKIVLFRLFAFFDNRNSTTIHNK